MIFLILYVSFAYIESNITSLTLYFIIFVKSSFSNINNVPLHIKLFVILLVTLRKSVHFCIYIRYFSINHVRYSVMFGFS